MTLMTSKTVEKFSMKNVSDYLVAKSYTSGTKQSQYSILTDLYEIVVIHDINENFNQIMVRLNQGKSQKTADMRISVVRNFLIFQNGLSPVITQKTPSVLSFEETKIEFKTTLLKFVNQLRIEQANNEVDQIVSFYIREGKQLTDLFGYLPESVLLKTISARFNKKKIDSEFVTKLVKQFFPNPETKKTWLDLPQKGEFLEFVKKTQNVQTMTKDQILKKYPNIDPLRIEVLKSIPKKDPKYVWLKGERDFITVAMLLNENLFISGSAGLGKSSMLLQWCFEESVPYVRTSCNYSADPQDNYFEQGFNGTRVEYVMISLGLSFIYACMIGACLNSQEEINSSNEATMIGMHSATDSIKSLNTKMGDLELNEGCKLLVAGSGNIGYGQGELTPALQSRLIPFEKLTPSDDFILKNIWI